MTFEEFENRIRTRIEKAFENEADIDVRDVEKHNGIIYRGITVCFEDASICPTLYIDDMYEEYIRGKEIDEITERTVAAFRRAGRRCEIDISCLENKDWVLNHVYARVVSLDKNKSLLKKIEHIVYLDFAIVFYVVMEIENGESGTVMLTKSMFKDLDVDRKLLYNRAIENLKNHMEFTFKRIDEVLTEIMEFRLNAGEEANEDMAGYIKAYMEIPMYVAGNTINRYGSSAILNEDFLLDCAKKIGGDFYILPSSLHELIFVQATEKVDAEELKRMVKEINDTQIELCDVLSDSVYLYNYTIQKVSVL